MKMMKMTNKKQYVQINVSKETRAAIKLLAAEQQCTMHEYIDKLIARQLNENTF